MKQPEFIRPPRLRKGDVIGVVAPASPQRDDARLQNGIRYFETLGHPVTASANLWKRHGYLAGSDEERAADFNAMIHDPQVRMIVCGRGGYGSTRILEYLDYEFLSANPKIIVGFSDITAINCAFLARANLISFSGCMPGVDFWDPGNNDRYAEEMFWRSVTSDEPLGSILLSDNQPLHTYFPGRAEGWLLAGNLTMIASITGTPYLPDTGGAILLVEEIGEEPYRVDRMLSQLGNAGILDRIEGLALGAFTQAKPTRVSVESLPIEEVFEYYSTRYEIPTISGLPFGHIRTKMTVPLGARARIDAGEGTFQILDAGVS